MKAEKDMEKPVTIEEVSKLLDEKFKILKKDMAESLKLELTREFENF